MTRAVVPLLFACLAMALPAFSAPGQGRNETESQARAFRIDGIQEARVDPCRSRLLVKYFIDPALGQPCFISATIPGGYRAGFEVKPAGGRGGVPKGEVPTSEANSVEIHFLGLKPLETRQVEVSIRDASGPLYTKTFPWSRLWARFAVQGIRPVKVAPDFARILVRYFIDPAFPDACYISGFVPGLDNCSNDFNNLPAGFVPAGVAKGQNGFASGVGFDLMYKGGAKLHTSTLDVVIYSGPKQNLLAAPFPWEKTWSPAAKR